LTLDEILEEWDVDTKIDPLDLGGEALKISRLHHKYTRQSAIENRELRRLEARRNQLVSLKTDYYLGNLNGTDQLEQLGWEPMRRVLLKADVGRAVEVDKDVVKLTEILGEQREKSEILKSIVKEIMTRSFNIRASIEMMKYNAGAL
jgi:hypothetical protein